MPNINSLDRIIRLIDSTDKPTSPNEKRIIIDLNNMEILQRPPVFSWGKDLRYYLVSSQNNVECEGLVCKVRDSTKKHAVNIVIDYDVSCPNGSEEYVVKALCNGDNPKIVLETHIERWVKAFNRLKRSQEINLITSFFTERKQLQQYITEQAAQETGLELYPSISLEGEENLEVIKKTSECFPIRVKDFDADISVKYKVGWEVLEDEHKINAILNYNHLSKLHLITRDEVEKFLIRECTLHQLCYEFDQFVKPQLIYNIDQKLIKEGRKIAYIKFELGIHDLIVTETPMIVHDTECKLKDSEASVKVKNRVLMQLDDLGKFRKAKIADLEPWLSFKLDKVVQKVFFERDRIDLLRNLENDKSLIQNYLQKETRKIGYSVQHLAFLPDLEELTLLQGFKIDNKSSYRTKDNQVKIKVEITIHSKVKSFEGIESYLKDGVDQFKAKIIDRSKNIIEQKIREQYPSDIYASEFEGENAIDKLLEGELTAYLENTFQLVDTRVSILLYLNTDIIKRINGLKAAFPNFEVEVTPHNISLTVPYKISYDITGIHPKGFATFQAKAFKPEQTDKEINQLNDRMANEFKGRMNTVPIEVVRYRDFQTLDKTINTIVTYPLKHIAQISFGLIISELKIRRLQTKQEIAESKKSDEFLKLGTQTEIEIAQEEAKTKIARVKELKELEKSYLKTGDKKELKKVRKQIKKLTKQSANYMDGYKQQQKLLDPVDTNNKNSFSIDSYLSLQIESPKEDTKTSNDSENYEDYNEEN